jgi:CheY-like chemotaxis protein
MVELRKILYIEDNPDSQELVKIYFRGIAELDCYDMAENIIQIVSDNNYDLVLMDINLPGKIDGVDAVRLLRRDERFKKIPIIAVTAYAMVGDRERFLEVGCDDYISKPFFKQALLDKAKRFL